MSILGKEWLIAIQESAICREQQHKALNNLVKNYKACLEDGYISYRVAAVVINGKLLNGDELIRQHYPDLEIWAKIYALAEKLLTDESMSTLDEAVLSIELTKLLTYAEAKEEFKKRVLRAIDNQEPAPPNLSKSKIIQEIERPTRIRSKALDQDEILLSTIKKLGVDPKSLPANDSGGKGIKSKIKAEIEDRDPLEFRGKNGEFSESIFKHCWDRARDGEAIMYLKGTHNQ